MMQQDTTGTDYDSPWKEALEVYFEAFMAFCFPKMYRDIDWTAGYEFMDKELEKIVRDSETGRRHVDKLVKVFLKNGGETWLLIHIEVQGYRDREFPRRMYIYNYRIDDRYDMEVISLAVLTDDSPSYRPSEYHRSRWDCELIFRFPTIKVLDFEGNWDKLENDPNPFSMVIMAHLKSRSVKDGQERKRWKLHLMRLLIRRGYGRKDILELFRFIDWLLILPEELDIQFREETIRMMEEEKMPYITSIEKLARKEGYDKGLEQGIEQGIEQGKYQGIREGLLEAIELGLNLRFGEESLKLMPRIRRIRKLDRLRTIKEAIRTVPELAEFEQQIQRKA